jgi:small-conductance mechanosensitive channel
MQELMVFSRDYPYLASLIIIAATAIIGRIINWLFEKIIRKAVGKTKTDVDDKIFELLRRPVFWSILLAGIFIATQILPLGQAAASPISKILVTGGIVVWGLAGIGFSRILFTQLEDKAGDEHKKAVEDFLPFLDNVVIIGVGILVLLTSLSLWGINITPALASAGVVGVAVAFAAKDTVANIFGGISVFLDKPYKTGDYVIIKDKYRGEVIQIGMRSTKIRTRDNVLLTVPNAVMATDAVINETGFNPELRIRIPLGIAYGTDLEKADKILVEIVNSHPEILKKPKARVRFRKFGESAIELEVLSVIRKPADRGRITHEIIKLTDKRLRDENINLPFPQRDVHLFQEK